MTIVKIPMTNECQMAESKCQAYPPSSRGRVLVIGIEIWLFFVIWILKCEIYKNISTLNFAENPLDSIYFRQVSPFL
jgi:hypothetical protein